MRAQLLDLQVAVGKWVIAENSYRLRLTVIDKKILEESEVRSWTFIWNLCVQCTTVLCDVIYYTALTPTN